MRSVLAWESFYQRHAGEKAKCTFFKDRHYLRSVFPELLPPHRDPKAWSPPLSPEDTKPTQIGVEFGCGVGNTIFPLLRANPDLFIHGVDSSATAIQLLHEQSEFSPFRVSGVIGDTADASFQQQSTFQPNTVDFVIMVHYLGTLHNDEVQHSLFNANWLLRHGGRLFLRDYAKGDLREATTTGLRQDGTRIRFFSPKCIQSMAADAGFHADRVEVDEATVLNRKRGLTMERKQIQAVLYKT